MTDIWIIRLIGIGMVVIVTTLLVLLKDPEEPEECCRKIFDYETQSNLHRPNCENQ